MDKLEFKKRVKDIDELEFMIKLTKHAEFLGFEVKDKLYIDKNRYIGKIFRFFSLEDANNFLNSNNLSQCSDFFINAQKLIGKGNICARYIRKAEKNN